MNLKRQLLALVVILLVVGFVAILIVCLVWPPTGDTFRVYVAKEAAKVALQLLGLTVVGAIVSEIFREARERKDFALRLRASYGKTKASRRRLRRLPATAHATELELVDAVQLEFEDLRDEAEWIWGSSSLVVENLSLIEKYLHDVVDAGIRPVAGNRKEFDVFVQHYVKGSRFDTDFKKTYSSRRTALR
jgi:hypothetical protein